MQNVNMKKLVVGCGYLGQRVAAAWRNQGNDVYVLTRSKQRAESLRQLGYLPIVGDITQRTSLDGLGCLGGLATVLFAVGYDRKAEPSLREVYVEGLRQTLTALAPNAIDRFIYISSTGVYGQSGDEWVDEESPCMPTREGGQACLAGEELLKSHATLGGRSVVLRLAGIYGPDRVPRINDLTNLNPLQINADSYLNLIQVDDACRIILAAEFVATPNLFVVADGTPVKRRDFYNYAGELLEVPVTFAPLSDQASARQRAPGGKRCRVNKLQNQVEFESQYPTYREGLQQILNTR